MTSLFAIGMGYSALALASRLAPRGWRIAGTATTSEGAARLHQLGYDAHIFDGTRESAADAGLLAALAQATHVVVSAPPGAAGDPALRCFAETLEASKPLSWVGYLSTIGVYGDHKGGWVDEDTPETPGSDRSRRRVEAERAWLAFGATAGTQVQVFRLAGIYGPGRSAIDTVLEGTARRVIKPGQVFNRTHVSDIAAVLDAAIAHRVSDSIFNVTDDEPAPPQDVIAFAATLLGRPVPLSIDFDSAEMSPMGRSFYAENKRVRNDRIKSVLGVELQYPTYREGLRAIAAGLGVQS